MIDIPNGPWAIAPQALEALQASARAAASAHPTIPATVNQPVEMVDGVAVLTLSGVLFRDPSILAMLFGSSTVEFAGQITSAAEDSDVRAILVEIDSPGGEVRGVQAAARAVAMANQAKPVGVLASGTMASAAVWIGIQAGTVALADQTTTAGSIGVVATHVDVSGAQERFGVKTTEVVAGSYKRIASSYAPLTSAGRAELQRQVDLLYGVFLDEVGAARGVTADQAHKQFGDGRTFFGQEAVAVGLVDRIATRQEMFSDLERLAALPGSKRKAASTTSASGGHPAPMAKRLTDYIATQAKAGRRISAAMAFQELSRLGQ